MMVKCPVGICPAIHEGGGCVKEYGIISFFLGGGAMDMVRNIISYMVRLCTSEDIVIYMVRNMARDMVK